jgi:hypothetical protein
VIRLLPKSCHVEVKNLVDQFPSLPVGGDLADIHGVDPDALLKVITEMEASVVVEASIEDREGKFAGRSAAELWDTIDEEVDWLVEGVIAGDQPTIFGAKQKSLKTTLLADLAVALATGTPWLGKFAIPHQRRVLFITGESSDKGSMKRIRRAVESRGLGREDLGDELRIETVNFPNLPSEEDCFAVRSVVQKLKIEVVIVDPLYMGLQGINASNLMEVGPSLRRFMECCKPAAIILAHHVKKTTNYDDAPNLEDLSQAGIAEFAGNYWMMGRLSEYLGDGKHELAVRYGGRDDQFGLFKMDFDEEEWSANWMELQEWRAKAESDKEDDKLLKAAAVYENQKELVRAKTAGVDEPFSANTISQNGKFKPVLERMVEDGFVERAETPKGRRGNYYQMKEIPNDE